MVDNALFNGDIEGVKNNIHRVGYQGNAYVVDNLPTSLMRDIVVGFGDDDFLTPYHNEKKKQRLNLTRLDAVHVKWAGDFNDPDIGFASDVPNSQLDIVSMSRRELAKLAMRENKHNERILLDKKIGDLDKRDYAAGIGGGRTLTDPSKDEHCTFERSSQANAVIWNPDVRLSHEDYYAHDPRPDYYSLEEGPNLHLRQSLNTSVRQSYAQIVRIASASLRVIHCRDPDVSCVDYSNDHHVRAGIIQSNGHDINQELYCDASDDLPIPSLRKTCTGQPIEAKDSFETGWVVYLPIVEDGMRIRVLLPEPSSAGGGSSKFVLKELSIPFGAMLLLRMDVFRSEFSERPGAKVFHAVLLPRRKVDSSSRLRNKTNLWSPVLYLKDFLVSRSFRKLSVDDDEWDEDGPEDQWKLVGVSGEDDDDGGGDNTDTGPEEVTVQELLKDWTIELESSSYDNVD